jgi:hypothetical protein
MSCVALEDRNPLTRRIKRQVGFQLGRASYDRPSVIVCLTAAVGGSMKLALLHRARPALDDAGGDVGKGGKLGGQRQARRAAADDEDVDRLRQVGLGPAGGGFGDLRVAGPEAVEGGIASSPPSGGVEGASTRGHFAKSMN